MYNKDTLAQFNALPRELQEAFTSAVMTDRQALLLVISTALAKIEDLPKADGLAVALAIFKTLNVIADKMDGPDDDLNQEDVRQIGIATASWAADLGLPVIIPDAENFKPLPADEQGPPEGMATILAMFKKRYDLMRAEIAEMQKQQAN